MALGLSKDSGFIAAPLAITVIGGLTTSTLLTLLLVPTLYVLIEGRQDRQPGSLQTGSLSAQPQDTQPVVQGA
jgi:HAE1 family hydrophobic/amphiphilic exporter-1